MSNTQFELKIKMSEIHYHLNKGDIIAIIDHLVCRSWLGHYKNKVFLQTNKKFLLGSFSLVKFGIVPNLAL